jgi:threonine aldolase
MPSDFGAGRHVRASTDTHHPTADSSCDNLGSDRMSARALTLTTDHYPEMSTIRPRRQFSSDNNAGICPEALEAIHRYNAGHVVGYGDDEITAKAAQLFKDLFGTDCITYFVFNGTAANSLSIGAFCSPHHSVLCHRFSHIESDECNAPGFLNQGLRIVPVDGANGKIDPSNLREILRGGRPVHASQPRVLSLTNTTELGTLYDPDAVAELTGIARENELAVHMDGARFANAVASANCSPAELTWKLGIDVLVFGGTKNGLGFGEAIVFFNKDAAANFRYGMKQSGQLASKMRFLASQWIGLLSAGKWLEYARHSNRMADRLCSQLSRIETVKILFPRESNAVFAKIPQPVVAKLYSRGWRFYTDVGPSGGGARLMCSWDTTAEDVDSFVKDILAS